MASPGSTAAELNEATPQAMPDATKKKPRRRNGKKSTAKRGPTALPYNRGTGFEEYFADPPLTPQEAVEEKDEIYSEDLSFEERIQSCIQRFRGRRRLQGDKTRFFNEYLFLGGIDSNPNFFTGMDPKELKTLTPAERRDATARDVVYTGSSAGDRFYNGDLGSWVVDFEGVAAGFFSATLDTLSEQEMQTAIGVVDNFLRYVAHHDVCPEFAGNIDDALEVCVVAQEEWYKLRGLRSALPGQFNLAAAKLFCTSTSDDWSFLHFQLPENFDPKSVFYGTFALLDEPERFAGLCEAEPTVKEYECTLEIVDKILPDEKVAERFNSLTVDSAGIGLSPIGKILCKPSTIEDGWDHPATLNVLGSSCITLYFEDNILFNMKVGMKMVSKICELDTGIHFVKTIISIVPTYYTFLPQVLMKYFKTPRDNDRAAPSIHHLEAEEEQFASEAKGE